MDANGAELVQRIEQTCSEREERAVLQACCEVLTEQRIAVTAGALFGVLFQSLQQILSLLAPNVFEKNTEHEDDADSIVTITGRCRATVRLIDCICGDKTSRLSDQFVLKAWKETSTLVLSVFSHNPPVKIVLPVLNIARTFALVALRFDSTLPSAIEFIRVRSFLSSLLWKPKMRKRAVEELSTIAENPLMSANAQKQFGALLLRFVSGVINECRQDNVHAMLYTLEMLKVLLPQLVLSAQKKICERLLRLPAIGHSLLTVCTFNVFGALFSAWSFEPPSEKCVRDVLAPLVLALRDVQPHSSDSDALIAFSNTTASAYCALATADATQGEKKLLLTLSFLIPLLQNDSEKVRNAVAGAIERVLGAGVTKEQIEKPADSNPLPAVVDALRPSLQFSFQVAWAHSFEIFDQFSVQLTTLAAPLDEGKRKAFASLFHDILTDSAEHLQKTDGAQDRWTSSVQAFLASTLTLIGIREFLAVVPVVDYPAAQQSSHPLRWVLPFLIAHSHGAELAVFSSDVIPKIDAVAAALTKAKKEQKKFEVSLLRSVQLNLWELLSAFSRAPSDIAIAFPALAQKLFKVLIEKPKLRMIVGGALQALIARTLTLEDNSSAVIASYAKHYLPGIFAALLNPSHSAAHRTLFLDVATAFLGIADAALVEQSFKTAATKLIKASGEGEAVGTTRNFTIGSLCDIMSILVPRLAMPQVELLFRTIRPLLNDKEGSVQKKALKVFVKICEKHRVLVRENMDEMRVILEETQPQNRNAATKKLRVNVMRVMLEEGDGLSLPLLEQILPEIILYTKEVNAKTRDASEALVLYLGERCVAEQSLPTLIEVIAAGFALDPHFISATIRTLTVLLKVHFTQLPQNVQRDLVATTIMFLNSKNREVVATTLDFVRMAISRLPEPILRTHLPDIVKGLMSWSEESKNKFRVKVKVILEKLVRRLGFDSVAPLVPYATLMTNIRKAIARKDRQRKDGGRKGDRNGSDSDEDESDSDDMEDVAPVRGKARRAQGGGAYVVEGKSDRDILDFLAPSASKHVRSVGPEQRGTKRGREDKFERNEEGRMIIEDLPEKDNLPKKKRSRSEQQDADRIVPNAMLGKDFIKKNADKVKQQRAEMRKGAKQLGGEMYKARAAGGDVKKGKHEPYTYMPLDPAQLNKRSRRHAHKRYESVVSRSKPKDAGITKTRGRVREKLKRK